MAARSAARSRSRRAPARSTRSATAGPSFTPALLRRRQFSGTARLLPLSPLSLRPRSPIIAFPRHDPNLFALADRVGRVRDDPLVLSEAAREFNLGPEIARNVHLPETNAVVRTENGELYRAAAID